MGQKIHPIGFRLSVNRNWSSKWFANSKHFAPTLKEDIKVREYLKKKLAHASVGKITIERPAKNARITIHSARPGVVIGKKGEDIETLRADLRKMMGGDVGLNIEEIRKPEIDAQLIAASIGQQLRQHQRGGRITFRGLQDECVAADQGDRRHPQRHHHREIERRDAHRHAQRLTDADAVDPIRGADELGGPRQCECEDGPRRAELAAATLCGADDGGAHHSAKGADPYPIADADTS